MLIENVLMIDWSTPAVRKAFARGRSNGGTLSWHCGDVELASIGFTWNAASKRIELRFVRNGVSCVQRIKVVETAPHFGGSRCWFWCEFSDRRTRCLVLPPASSRWVARGAARLPYRCQRERSGAPRRFLADMRRERAQLHRNAVRRLRRGEIAASFR